MVLSLHKQPFVTAHFQFITAHFVHHCALKNALHSTRCKISYATIIYGYHSFEVTFNCLLSVTLLAFVNVSNIVG